MVDSKIAILILAAGASTRMGKTKQLLEWKGKTLLGHAIDSALAIENAVVYVVIGANSETIKSSQIQKAVKWVCNNDWKSGLGSSIAIGVKSVLDSESKTSGVLVMLADQPLIDLRYLRQIIDSFHENRKGIVATAYKNGRGVPALFGHEYYKDLMSLKSDKGAKDLLMAHQKDVNLIVAVGKVKDIDTLEDYTNLKELK